MDIEIIKQDNFKIPDRKHVLFERWLRKYLSASWDDVILALELIDESHLAHSVQANRKQWVRFNITCIYVYLAQTFIYPHYNLVR